MRIAAALAACLLMAGCEGGGIDFSGGLHDLLQKGVSITLVTVPTCYQHCSRYSGAKIKGPPQ